MRIYVRSLFKTEKTNFMKTTIALICFLTFVCFACSCSAQHENKQSRGSNSLYDDDDSADDVYLAPESEENEEPAMYSSECKLEDGTYSSTVEYYNPNTGYSGTYSLDVEVQDCQVVQINFPNGGYLDEDDISYSDIDEDGNASVDGEDGKTYEIHIDD
ncbi:MAG: hypothetical protein CRN43_00935 [Candidatus Nephrothrix sp. EaCA]|nr:MAG: hypothetical protein CRN43_00935 [Candidatus Nephrothrix sp. EaCA]